jgi:hypothetical protein
LPVVRHHHTISPTRSEDLKWLRTLRTRGFERIHEKPQSRPDGLIGRLFHLRILTPQGRVAHNARNSRRSLRLITVTPRIGGAKAPSGCKRAGRTVSPVGFSRFE